MKIPNITNEIEDLRELLQNIHSEKKNSSTIESYFLNANMFLNRYDSINKYIEDELELNDLRTFRYPFSIRTSNEINDIMISATTASSFISGIYKSIKTIYPKASLSLTNILRGSTILCFDYSNENYFDDDFDREKTSTTFSNFCNLLTGPEDIAKSEIQNIIPTKSNLEQLLKSMKSLSPVIGDESITKINIDFIESPIELDSDVRKTINYISPPKARKNPAVDWDAQIAIGFIREINNVTKSFVMYGSLTSSDNADALIKLFYEDTDMEKYILTIFNKKIHVKFETKNRKYYIKTIS
jgi:hypothetical protein